MFCIDFSRYACCAEANTSSSSASGFLGMEWPKELLDLLRSMLVEFWARSLDWAAGRALPTLGCEGWFTKFNAFFV